MASSKDESQAYKAFMESGECSDEITFVFDADRKLYVSQNLLTLASPVFKAMFDSKSNFKENTERKVKIVDMKFEDFREFLHCIHPDILKPVASDNVLHIASIAEKYQSQVIISRCKKCMELWLDRLAITSNSGKELTRYESAHASLRILHKASELNYEQIRIRSINTIVEYNSMYFTGMLIEKGNCSTPELTERLKQARKICRNAFLKIDVNTRMYLLLARLGICDD